MDYNTFFGRKSEVVARELLGKKLSRAVKIGELSGTIAETGAYEGGDITSSRNGMLYRPGTLFLMPFRGYHLLNIATDREGFPSCVEIRKILVPGKQIEGSGAISRFFNMEDFNGVLLGDEVNVCDNVDFENFEIVKREGGPKNCLGFFSFDYR